MQVTVQKWGNSNAVRIPKAILEVANVVENEDVEMTAEKGKITLCKVKRYKTLEERFVNYEGNCHCEEYDWGQPVGKEVW